ncbi:MAG: endonuclease/exonuclease/phosphatase family protein [Rhizobacter sp.]|nr:endonuclease/exonuclease/phosphatase family protein [Rhizobacter sp.]
MPIAPANPRSAPAVRARTGWLRAGVWFYLAVVLAVVVALQWQADAWWPATLILFSPRWPWAMPLLILVPLALLRARRLLWPLTLAAMLLLFGVSGFVPPSMATLAGRSEAAELRVLTYNLGGGIEDPAMIAPWLDVVAPQVALFQECAVLLEPARKTLAERGWHVEVQQGSCLVSRYPIRRVEARDPTAIWKTYGSGVVVRYEVQTPGRSINLVNVHLMTVRPGLNAIRHRRWGGISELESNTEQRDLESMLASAFAQQSNGPLIVAGDFNMPVESAIYRRHWSPWANAFSCAGYGLGSSKATSWHGVRIDHVLLGPGWSCLRTQVGTGLGGDHRPVIADIRWGGR